MCSACTGNYEDPDRTQFEGHPVFEHEELQLETVLRPDGTQRSLFEPLSIHDYLDAIEDYPEGEFLNDA